MLQLSLLGGAGALCGWLLGEVALAGFAGLASDYSPPALLSSAPDLSRFQLAVLEQPVLPFKPELQERLDREQAQTGDVQISLMWNDENDLDLHCVDPYGVRIFHNHRKSPSGGELDVDMNAREEVRYRYQVEKVPHRIALVLDYSGSMRGRRLEEMKTALTKFISALGLAGNEIAVVPFSSDASLAVPFSGDAATILGAIQGRAAGGRTRMGLGMALALRHMGRPIPNWWQMPAIAARPPAGQKDVLLLFTDGKVHDEEDCRELAKIARRQGVELVAIGTGGANLDFLRELTGNPNNALFAQDGGLVRLFGAVAARLASSRVTKSPEFEQAGRRRITNAVHSIGLVLGTGWTTAAEWQGTAAGGALLLRGLLAEGHSAFLASVNAQGPFATRPTTNLTELIGALNSISPNRVTPINALVRTALRHLRPFDRHAAGGQSGLVIVEPLQTAALSNGPPAELHQLVAAGYPCFDFQIEQPDPASGARRTSAFRVVEQPTESWGAGVAGPLVMPFTNQAAFFTWAHSRVLRRMEFAPAESAPVATGTRISGKPVENVFWPKGGALAGTYQVEVVHYRNYTNPPVTPYHVAIRTATRKFEFDGAVAAGQTNAVHSFTLDPAEDHAQWVAAQTREQRLRLAPDKARYLRELQSAVAAWRHFPGRQWRHEMSVAALWTGLVALWIGGVLQFGHRWLALRQRGPWSRVRSSAVIMLLAGAAGGLVVQPLGVAVPEWWLEIPVPLAEVNRVAQILGWPVLGLVLGLGMTLAIPNLKGRHAALAGVLGGLIGGLAFGVAAGPLSDAAARCAGAASLGLALGLIIRFIEQLAREAALVVHWDEHERSVLNLGPRPIVLGSGRHADLYLPREKGFPETTATITFNHGLVEVENRLSGRNSILPGGQRLRLGPVWLEVRTDESERGGTGAIRS